VAPYGAGGLSVRWVPEVNTCRLRVGGFDDNDVTCRFVSGDGKKVVRRESSEGGGSQRYSCDAADGLSETPAQLAGDRDGKRTELEPNEFELELTRRNNA